jgi:translation elongation factor EF-1beta
MREDGAPSTASPGDFDDDGSFHSEVLVPLTSSLAGCSFEWYCSADEVVRVLSLHLVSQEGSDPVVAWTDASRHTGPPEHDEKIVLGERRCFLKQEEATESPSKNSDGKGNERHAQPRRRILHPGSGTSLVPRRLLDAHHPLSDYCHVVVDVSAVAIQQARSALAGSHTDRIEYRMADLLKDPLTIPFDDGSFAASVDKGFVDAVFSSANPEGGQQAGQLFQEILRVLEENEGVFIIVSLAEEHSLSIILEKGWLAAIRSSAPLTLTSSEKTKRWASTLHVHEVEPTSGDMRPFAFVMTTSVAMVTSNDDEPLWVEWHSSDSDRGDEVAEKIHVTRESALAIVRERVQVARSSFVKGPGWLPKVRRNRILAAVEVKPSDPDVDLAALGRRVVDTRWSIDDDNNCPKLVEIAWQPQPSGYGNSSPFFELVPIGFGISKLRMKCVVDAEVLDELVTVMEEELCDLVQSVDVDWQATVRVCDSRDLSFLSQRP